MGHTAAERQAAYRERMQAKGFCLKHIWVDADGFFGSGKRAEGMEKPVMTLSQLLNDLTEVTDGTDEGFQTRLYGELAVYARSIRELRDLAGMSPELFQTEDTGRPEKKLQCELF